MSEHKAPARSKALAIKVLYKSLQILAESDGYVSKDEVHDRIPSEIDLTDWELEKIGKNKTKPRWKNAFWHTSDAVKAGLMLKVQGKWKITQEGRELLAEGPEAVFEVTQKAYRDWQENRTSNGPSSGLGAPAKGQILRQGMLALEGSPGRRLPWDEVLRKVEKSLPDDLLEALESHDGDWLDNYGYRSFYGASRAGWLVRSAGNWTLTDSGVKALREWSDPATLIKKARQVAGGGKEKEKIPYLGQTVDLSTTPQSLYQVHSASIGQLVGEIEHGTLALPDIQRPFVWKNAKVRDLLDSMFRGFPFGFLLTWKSPDSVTSHTIGVDNSTGIMPHALVIDGQQRLTSLYAVMTGRPVVDSEFRERHIRIGFHPIKGVFAVADAATKRNPEWLPDVSKVFTNEMGALAVVRNYLKDLEEAREVNDEHRSVAEKNITRLVNLKNIPVNVLQVGLGADEEQVAEIFVRINSRGQNLRQADFILTLLAVFWQQGREDLEEFARSCRTPAATGQVSPFNAKLHPGPDDLVRVAVAVGHRRAKMSAAYQILRGKDLKSGETTAETRDKNLTILEKAQAQVLDAGNWHEFLKVLSAAGFRHKKLLQSEITALYAYALFLIGRESYGLNIADLRKVIGRWFMMSTVTGRYVGGSSESAMEEDLAKLREIEKGEDFLVVLEQAMAAELTNDFWTVTLPSRLESSNTRTLSSFFAAQGVLGARALFSNLTVAELFNPQEQSTKEDLEIHHLFPKGWLKKQGITSPREYNQVANLSLLEWAANIDVSDDDPAQYAPRLAKRMKMEEADIASMEKHHALPPQWSTMDYRDFLVARRKAMAEVIRAAFDRIS